MHLRERVASRMPILLLSGADSNAFKQRSLKIAFSFSGFFRVCEENSVNT